jgi:hypothetical protein
MIRQEPIPVAAWLLGLRFRIPLGAWMFISCVSMLCCPVQVEVCDGLISRPEEFYSVSNCVCDHRNPEGGPSYSWERNKNN